MKKEEVIIFEGEHNFVVPKNRVRNKKTGVSYYVPNEMNVTAPVGTPMEEPIEPPKQPDEPIGSPKTTTTQQEDASKPTNVPSDTTLASKNALLQQEPSISLGGASKIQPTQEVVPPTTPVVPIVPVIPTLPIDMGVAPSRMVGGGGGGGGSKDAPATPKKTFLQKYWWLLLLVAGGGGYYYYKKNKK